MHRRQTLPRLWMMTDERQGERLWSALERLPRGSGVVFRHYSLQAAKRHMLFLRVKKICRRKGISLLLAGPPKLAAGWGADGSHGLKGAPVRGKLLSAPVHTLPELRAAEAAGAHLLFVSPLFATRSHPGARALGRVRFGQLAQRARRPVIALGGMERRRAVGLGSLGAYGWAAIDAWTE